MITLVDGSQIPIKEVREGLTLRSWNSATNKVSESKVVAVHVHAAEELLIISINDPVVEIIVTPKHLLRTKGGWKAAAEIEPGSLLILAQGALSMGLVSHVRRADGDFGTIYNLTTEPDHTFVAENVVVHNAKKQNPIDND